MKASATATRLHLVKGPAPFAPAQSGRRRMTPAQGRAIEILAHAIEYLTDQYVCQSGALSLHDPDVEAIQILMQLNRRVYFDCPLAPSFAERCRALFQLRSA